MPNLLVPGQNCWKIAKANRFALLVDGSNYYGALSEAMVQARENVSILGWDLDSRVSVFRDASPQQWPPPLRDFLPDLASRNRELNINILIWSFPAIFAHARDPELVRGRNPFRHPRIHLKFDDVHPPGASHHQKIVTIDDRLAFTGGMDIAGGRWDTPEHKSHDERRAGKDEPYPPSHDVQAIVDGDAAAALSEIAHDRWRKATGRSIPWVTSEHDPWPMGVKPDLTSVPIAISRTDTQASGATDCSEIERLHLDLIAAAQKSIYIENQYLTSSTIANALCCRLQEADGPEILIVLPQNNLGWLEDHTIEVLRFRLIEQLRAVDTFHRLRICYPLVANLDEGQSVGVHSKVIVIDDRFFRVGSSNLTNRSMRLDTECDLTIEATDALQSKVIAELRNRLLGEHLGLPTEVVDERLSNGRKMIDLVDGRSSEARCLRELRTENHSILVMSPDIVDPSEPLTPGFVIEAIAESVVGSRPSFLLPLTIIAIAAGVALAVILRKRR